MALLSCFATTPRGIEGVLSSELRHLGMGAVKASRGGVFFRGTLPDVVRANLWLRTANRVLMVLEDSVEVRTYEDLKAAAFEVRWEEHVGMDQSIAVLVERGRSPLRNSKYAAQVIKDGVVDRLRARTGRRPDVDLVQPDVRIHVYLEGDRARWSVDLSGEALFKRGYRVRQTPAPLRETLAAGILGLAGWNGRTPLFDPMCGSGTLLIEAAMMALDLPPGLRRRFAIERHPHYGEEAGRLLGRFRAEILEGMRDGPPAVVAGADVSWEAVGAARRNAEAAGVGRWIDFRCADATESCPVAPGGTVIANPPYGRRLGRDGGALWTLYRAFGERVRRSGAAHAWVLCAHPTFETAFGLPATHRYRLYNGALETWLYGYALEWSGRGRRRRRSRR